MPGKRLLISGAALAVIVAIGVIWALGGATKGDAAIDPRSLPPLVKTTAAIKTNGIERAFTGTIAARVQSDIGFRVPGKIIERFVDVGEEVETGQPLFRLDDADLRLALEAKENAVDAARASLVQAEMDERRYSALVQDVKVVSAQRYEQARTTLDTAKAALAAAEADRRVSANEADYATLVADADGIVVESMGEPGQVVQAGQVIARLAHAGPREAWVSLPETLRPAIGSTASATIYSNGKTVVDAALRQISDSADPRTRTYDARYVLNSDAARAPLGSTVVITLTDAERSSETEVPIGAILDDGTKSGVWIADRSTSTVHFAPVEIVRLERESAVVKGLAPGAEVVALGAHLLVDGTRVRMAEQ